MPKAVCPHCQAAFRVNDEMVGKRVRCAKCQEPFRIEVQGTTPSPAASRQSGPAGYRDHGVDAILEVRERIGAAPRQLKNDVFAADAIQRGNTRNLDMAEIQALLMCDDVLLDHGEVVWAAMVQANDLAFETNFLGPDDPPNAKPRAVLGTSIVAVDTRVGHLLGPLVATAEALHAARGQSFSDAAATRYGLMLARETEGWLGLQVPLSLSQGVPCMNVGMIYESRHLPNAKLTCSFYPVLVHPAVPGAMIVPSHFWGPAMLALWNGEIQPPSSDDAWKQWSRARLANAMINPQTGTPSSPPQGALQQTLVCLALHEHVVVSDSESDELLMTGYFPDDPIAMAGDLLRSSCLAADLTIGAARKRYGKLREMIEPHEQRPDIAPIVEAAEFARKADAALNRKLLFAVLTAVIMLLACCGTGIVAMLM